jgi:hypothetical protein
MADHTDMSDRDDREAALMADYGITRVPVDRFHYKTFRYHALADAVAQAKRDAEAKAGDVERP